MGFAGPLLAIIVILCGYFEVPFIPVVLVAGAVGSVKRLYTRQWQEKRYGFTNGGNTAAFKENKFLYFILIYLSMCIVEALSYGIGSLIRIITS